MALKIIKIIQGILPKSILFSIVCMMVILQLNGTTFDNKYIFLRKFIEIILVFGIGLLPIIISLLFIIYFVLIFYNNYEIQKKDKVKISLFYVGYFIVVCLYFYLGLVAEGKISP